MPLIWLMRTLLTVVFVLALQSSALSQGPTLDSLNLLLAQEKTNEKKLN